MIQGAQDEWWWTALRQRADEPEESTRQRKQLATTSQDVLDERRLRVAPRKANVDDRRYPAVVENGLKKRPQVSFRTRPSCYATTYASNLDELGNALLLSVSASAQPTPQPLCAPWYLRTAYFRWSEGDAVVVVWDEGVRIGRWHVRTFFNQACTFLFATSLVPKSLFSFPAQNQDEQCRWDPRRRRLRSSQRRTAARHRQFRASIALSRVRPY